MKYIFFLLSLWCFVLKSNPLEPVIQSQMSIQVGYSYIIDYYENKNWNKLIDMGRNLRSSFPDNHFSREALYYLGVAYYHNQQYDLSDNMFSSYLKEVGDPKFFDVTMNYKFKIARALDNGACVHLFGSKRMPKWGHAYKDALRLYDEVIITLFRSDISAKSLYHKGVLLLKMKEYQKSIESFQLLTQRFPKHTFSPNAYIGISEVYYKECLLEFPDENKYDLAKINMGHFKAQFPMDSRIDKVQENLIKMEECFSSNLLEVGNFYFKTKKYNAASIYYKIIVKKYPSTKGATLCKKRLESIEKCI